jgi:hypothetical protein
VKDRSLRSSAESGRTGAWRRRTSALQAGCSLGLKVGGHKGCVVFLFGDRVLPVDLLNRIVQPAAVGGDDGQTKVGKPKLAIIAGLVSQP